MLEYFALHNYCCCCFFFVKWFFIQRSNSDLKSIFCSFFSCRSSVLYFQRHIWCLFLVFSHFFPTAYYWNHFPNTLSIQKKLTWNEIECRRTVLLNKCHCTILKIVLTLFVCRKKFYWNIYSIHMNISHHIISFRCFISVRFNKIWNINLMKSFGMAFVIVVVFRAENHTFTAQKIDSNLCVCIFFCSVLNFANHILPLNNTQRDIASESEKMFDHFSFVHHHHHQKRK